MRSYRNHKRAWRRFRNMIKRAKQKRRKLIIKMAKMAHEQCFGFKTIPYTAVKFPEYKSEYKTLLMFGYKYKSRSHFELEGVSD